MAHGVISMPDALAIMTWKTVTMFKFQTVEVAYQDDSPH